MPAIPVTKSIANAFSEQERPLEVMKAFYDDVDSLRSGMARVTKAVDLASIGANATVDVAVTLAAGSCSAGDVVLFQGAAALENGLVVQGVHTVITDAISLRVSNVTAAPIDAASRTLEFLVIKPRTFVVSRS